MAEIKVYRTYDHYRDPVLDQVTAMIDKEGLTKKLGIVAEISSVSRSTLAKWRDGETRFPRHMTVMAVATSLNYQLAGFRQSGKLDVEQARKEAAKWRERQVTKKAAAKAKLIAARKAARAAGTPAGAASHRH